MMMGPTEAVLRTPNRDRPAPTARLRVALLVAVFLGISGSGFAQSPDAQSSDAQSPDAGPPALVPPETAAVAGTGPETPEPEPAPAQPSGAPSDTLSTTRHSLDIDGRRIDYTATAERLALPRDGAAGPEARIFYIAYVADPPEAGPPAVERPVTFVFNGGPGAASAFLNLGALGPRLVAFNEDGTVPPPPARLADNPQSWLAFTDLVFIDPVGTGFSRATGGDNPNAPFWGVRQDLESVSRFIRLYLTRTGRWLSPVFLAGESYGGFRSAALAEQLQTRYGVGVNGAILVSPVIEFSLIDLDTLSVLPWMAVLPSYAAAAIHHDRATALPDGTSPDGTGSLAAALAPVEAFARTGYLTGLARGAEMDGAERERFNEFLAQVTGLPPALIRRHNGRIPRDVFMRELLRDQTRVLGAYDASIAAIDPDPGSARFQGADPTLEGLFAPYTSAFNAYVRDELRFETDLPFFLLNYEVNRNWDWRSGIEGRQGFVGTAEDLESAMTLSPQLRVLIAHGYYDLVTPYFASAYVVDQLHLHETLRPNLTLRVYRGGHMFYTQREAREAFFRDARAFYDAAPGG